MSGLCCVHSLRQKGKGKITVRSFSLAAQLTVPASPSPLKQKEHSICSQQSWFYGVTLRESQTKPDQHWSSSWGYQLMGPAQKYLLKTFRVQYQPSEINYISYLCSTNHPYDLVDAPPPSHKVIHSHYLIGHKGSLHRASLISKFSCYLFEC